MGKLPAGVKIKWMRIVQVIPQLPRFDENEPKRSGWPFYLSMVSYASDSIGRIPLGIVPVEEDGSVYCEAPVGKPLYFQLLDERGMAVQSMRSATYVHPGEQLSCLGCHEDKWKPVGGDDHAAGLAAPAVEDRAGSGKRGKPVQLLPAGEMAGVR